MRLFPTLLRFAPWCCLGLLAGLPVLGGPARRAELPPLQKQFQAEAPAIIQKLKDTIKTTDGHLHIAVLPFSVRFDKEAYLNVGPLNRRLADRLERELLLALDPVKNADEVRILRSAGAAVLEKAMHRADHRAPAGRQAFFRGKYQPAWGAKGEMLEPHVFLTGVAHINMERRSVEVTVQAFDKKNKELQEVEKFEAAADFQVLSEANVSFVARGKPVYVDVAVADEKSGRTGATGEKERSAVQTIRDTLEESPVELQVLYDDVPQKLDYDARFPEPKENQRVVFRLHNKTKDRDFAVVLRVNGRNTFFPESDAPDNDPRVPMWVVRHGRPPIDITGFQEEQDKVVEFKVARPSEMTAAAKRYGEHAGTFSFVVFEEKRTGAVTPVRGPDDTDNPPVRSGEDDLLVLRRAEDMERPNSLDALQKHLRNLSGTRKGWASRGLIVEGATKKESIKLVEFEPVRPALLSLKLYYCDPRPAD